MKKIDITKLWLKVILLLNSFGSRTSLVLITAVGGCPVVLYCEKKAFLYFKFPAHPLSILSVLQRAACKKECREKVNTHFLFQKTLFNCAIIVRATKIADFLEIFQEGRGERSFLIPTILLQIVGVQNGPFDHDFLEKLQRLYGEFPKKKSILDGYKVPELLSLESLL